MKKLFLLIAVCLTGSCYGCSFSDLPTGDALFVVHGKTDDEETASSQINQSLRETEAARALSGAPVEEPPAPYAVLYEEPGAARGMYEPVSGCYTGALLNAGASIREFNREARHAVYVLDMELGGEFPSDLILACISAQATPLVLLHPEGGKPDLIQISRAALRLGEYNLPMFVSFCPVTSETEMTPEAYKVYFRHARSLLKSFAPLAASVWLADASVTDAHAYYPGHDAADWVGLMCRGGWEDKDFEQDIVKALDEFYMTYQRDKPVMLGPFGISHFSDTDYVYYTDETADELRRVYSEIRDGYPRVKLMAYADVNLIPRGGHHDFTFSGDEKLSAAYAEATGDGYFLKKLDFTGQAEHPVWLRSGAEGYFEDGKAVTSGVEVKDVAFIRPDHGKRVLYVYADRS